MTTAAPVRLDAIRRIGKALADPTRAAMLLLLLDRSRYPADLADELGITKQNASNHLACLRDCGIVVAEPSGRRVLYEISDARLRHALQDLVGVVLAVDPVDACDVSENDLEARS
ncbi:ArsR/SmtB family transcription factor [Microcella humidisoli]|uniref:Metalloregulator ArsR/SmtB family transcription factor n=1 Tax=Microcella humidisoli TaxID=2963406 RepID=A0ABY5FY93_9MICO|nr:metalloregulator ArsR/SmtB family transcription factor [Microcella humidisoli]UTT63238.1 metalloregulator ArsR/SmtB family transcription factor [Microcella humidisoli]